MDTIPLLEVEERRAAEAVLRMAQHQRLALAATIRRLEAKLGIIVSLDPPIQVLRMIEWGGDQSAYICPLCSASQTGGHEEGCELAAILAIALGEERT